MMKPLPLAVVIAALCIGASAPALASEDVGDPNMKFFYPDGSIDWEDQREFDRHFDRMDRQRKPKESDSDWKDPDREQKDTPPGSPSGSGQGR